MHLAIRLVATLLAAVLGAFLGFGAVALIFLVLGLDPGIGGGLIALLAGITGGIAAAVWTFFRLPCDRTPGRTEDDV